MLSCNLFTDKVKELAAVNAQLNSLKSKKQELEAFFAIEGAKVLKDTKSKSVAYITEGASVTYTEAQKLTLETPSYLKKILGGIFSDVIEEKTEPTYKVKSAAVERMLIGLYTGNYTRLTPAQVIAQLPCSDDQRAALTKKLKGANFETDTASLINIAGFSEDDASDYAYMYSEAVVYDTFLRILQLSGNKIDDTAIEELVKNINISVSVDDTTKITVK